MIDIVRLRRRLSAPLLAVSFALIFSSATGLALQNRGQVAVGFNPGVVVFNPVDGRAYSNILGPSGEGVVKINGNSLAVEATWKQTGVTVRALAIDSATNTLFVGDFWGFRVFPVDLSTGSFGIPFPTPGCHPFSLAFAPSTGALYVAGSVTGGNQPGCLLALNSVTGATVGSLSVPSLGDIAVNAGTGVLYLADFDRPVLVVVRGGPAAMAVTAEIPIGAQPRGIALNPLTHRIYVGGFSGSVWVVDSQSESVVTSIPAGNVPFRIAARPSVNRIYVSILNQNLLKVIDGATNTIIATAATGNSPQGVAADDIGGLIFTANDQGGTVSVFEDIPGKAPTSTTVESSNNPSSIGEQVTFTATVTSSAGTPSGTIVFRDGAQTLGSSALDAAGHASIETSTLATGAHSITASYPGDASHAGSSSAILVQNVTNSGACGVFGPAATYPAGTTPFAVTAGDFNGDGRSDAAVANINSGNIYVYLSNPDGTLQSPTSYSTGFFPDGISSGDFNDDGKPDLAVANNGSNNVSILLGIGNGTFQAPATYATGLQPRFVGIGDLNGDGRLDLAVPNENSGNVSVLLGNGNGTFQPASNFGAGTKPFSVAIQDFDGDGDLDLAVANYFSSDVSVLLGDGSGAFAAPVNYAVGNTPGSVAAGDLDEDGRIDLAVANGTSPYISILRGKGDGTFQQAANLNSGSAFNIVMADLDGDTHLDIVISGGVVFLGNGDGTFQPAAVYPGGGASVAVGDFNADGRPDLVLGIESSTNSVAILLGTCPCQPQPEVCDGLDNDCDGFVDEGIASQSTTCGVGACAATGSTSCVDGETVDSCRAGSPVAETCNGIDDDCDGSIDNGASASCTDGDACNGVESCQGGACVAGAPPVLSDGDGCTTDSCDPSTGVISHVPVNTDDGDACTTDTCNSQTGQVSHTPVATDDGNPCTVDSCNHSTGVVTHNPGNAGAQCRAGNGVCDPAETCDGVNTACPSDDKAPTTTSCDDSNACTTTDHCDGSGACTGGPALNVDDGNPCTVDSCNPASGAVHTPGNPGTVCRSSAGECDVAETCTGSSSTCPTDGYVPNGTACTDDGNACSADVCLNGSCAHEIDSHCASCVGNAPPVVSPPSANPSAPIPYNTSGASVTITVSYADLNTGPHTCVIAWGDGTSSPPAGAVAVTEPVGTDPGTCSGSHTYPPASNVYEATVTVTDDCGASGSAVYQYVVVYDPNSGFVTGGGWINSPPGAYGPDPALVGAANFGFVSKYQKNNSAIPTGETQFHFGAAGFRFDSDAYEWLVISGAKARYRGTGSVNGVPGYGFELTAWDGQVSGGGGIDRFRIKVWQGVSGNVIYDNERASPDGADPVTALQGGSIVIHKK